MRRIVALILLWVGLLGAASPLFACAAAAAAGDCCPPDAPAGCRLVYEQLDVVATACVVSSAQQLPERDATATNPVVFMSAVVSPAFVQPSSTRAVAVAPRTPPDHSLTYLHTGRLRL